MAQWQPTDEELVQDHNTDKMVNRCNAAAWLGFAIGVIVGAVGLVLTMIGLPGDFVYVQVAAAPTAVATPMDVILNLRDREGKNAEKWVCKYDREQGWLCEPMEAAE